MRTRSFVEFAIFAAVVFVMARFILGCVHASEEQLQAAAEGSYLAEHLRCVDEHETKREIDVCREAVRLRWHIQTTTTDAGRDAR